MSKIWIFDVDGTLSDPTHRRAYMRSKPRNYRAFALAAKDDPVIEPVAELLNTLYDIGDTIIIVSARGSMSEEKDILFKWLNQWGIAYSAIYTRAVGDYRKDSVVKKEILDEIRATHGEPFAVFDDRPQVQRMWIEEGLFVFKVNQTEEDF